MDRIQPPDGGDLSRLVTAHRSHTEEVFVLGMSLCKGEGEVEADEINSSAIELEPLLK